MNKSRFNEIPQNLNIFFKDIQATARSLEDKWESRKRDNKSVDRLAEKFTAGLSSYQKNRSGSLDIDLDDLVQRNLTKKASKSATLIEEENQKAAYYISGIEQFIFIKT